jgi:hypothetical protein
VTRARGTLYEDVVVRRLLDDEAGARDSTPCSKRWGRSSVPRTCSCSISPVTGTSRGRSPRALAGKADLEDNGWISVKGPAIFVKGAVPEVTCSTWGYEQAPQSLLPREDFPIAPAGHP